MGCGSSKEINPYEEHGIVRRNSPPAYMEKQGHNQMQVRPPQQPPSCKTSSGRPTAPTQYNYRLGKGDFDGFSVQQAQHADLDRNLTQYKSKGRPAVRAPARAQRSPFSLLNGSPFQLDEPPSPPTRIDDPLPWNIGNAQKKGRVGHAAPIRRPGKAKIEMEQTNCAGRWYKNRLTAEDIANWQWIRETRESDLQPLCARCLKEKKREDKKWTKNSTGGFIEISDMRRTNTQDFVPGQYSPI